MSEDQSIFATGIPSGVSFGGARLRMRTYYSLHHIRGAAQFTRQAKQVEDAYSGTFEDELFNEHRAYVTGAIILAVSFVEAYINELFSNASDSVSAEQMELDTGLVARLQRVWKGTGVERLSILDKYDLALTLANHAPLRGGAAHQNVVLAIALRNELAHYKPQWTSVDESRKLPAQLEAIGFSRNPLMPHNPFFPDQSLSYGCARWITDSCLRYVREFSAAIGITPIFDVVPCNLTTG